MMVDGCASGEGNYTVGESSVEEGSIREGTARGSASEAGSLENVHWT